VEKMKKHKLWIYILIFSAIFIIAVLHFNKKKSKDNLIKIKVIEPTRSVFYSPQYAAIELGFFKKEGLDVEIMTAGGSDKAMASVLSEQSDIALLGIEAVVYVFNEGRKNFPILFAQLTKKDGSFLIGKSNDWELIENFGKQSGIPKINWQALKGKSIIAGRIGGMPEMCLEHVLKNKKIFDEVELLTNIKFDLMGPAFLSGTGDYVMLFEPLASDFEKKGYVILSSVGTECEEITYTCYCASKDYIDKKPDNIQKFTNAIYKAQTWIANHGDEEIADAMLKYFPDSDKKLLLSSVKNYKAIQVWAENPLIKKQNYDTVQQMALEAGLIKQKTELNEIYNENFALKSVSRIIE
jgi:NitT/TauT family transport system substrate-binding protein